MFILSRFCTFQVNTEAQVLTVHPKVLSGKPSRGSCPEWAHEAPAPAAVPWCGSCGDLYKPSWSRGAWCSASPTPPSPSSPSSSWRAPGCGPQRIAWECREQHSEPLPIHCKGSQESSLGTPPHSPSIWHRHQHNPNCKITDVNFFHPGSWQE